MCHLVLFMPVFALPVFWLLPWPMATAIYLVVVVLSAWFYYVVIRIMHRPSPIGIHTLLNSHGTLVQANGSCGLARIGRELWKVESSDSLQANEDIKVTGRHGFVLEVVRTGPEQGTGSPATHSNR